MFLVLLLMDLQQNKLTKSEWESIEIPSTPEEKIILKLIIRGYHNVNLKINDTLSILSFLKLENTDTINDHIFIKYLQPELVNIFKKYKTKYTKINLNTKILSKADSIRFTHMEKKSNRKKILNIRIHFN